MAAITTTDQAAICTRYINDRILAPNLRADWNVADLQLAAQQVWNALGTANNAQTPPWVLSATLINSLNTIFTGNFASAPAAEKAYLFSLVLMRFVGALG
jgi:hypothetical protein